MHVALVPCSTGDKGFAFRVTEEAMRAYVEEAFGVWDANDQRRRLEESFDPSIYRLIVVDRVRAGILAVEDRPSEIFISRIFLLPRFQRQGIGSTLMGQLIEWARAERKPLRLRVLVVNPARSLYERLGFSITTSSPTHHYMEYWPTRSPG
jgi:GNAT superfamily N-acetyltransferase